MRIHWEYVAVLWEASCENVDGSWVHSSSIRVWRPDRDVEERPGDSRVSVLNDLGAEGWELATETIEQTSIAFGARGYTDVGYPVAIRWTLKRPKV